MFNPKNNRKRNCHLLRIYNNNVLVNFARKKTLETKRKESGHDIKARIEPCDR